MHITSRLLDLRDTIALRPRSSIAAALGLVLAVLGLVLVLPSLFASTPSAVPRAAPAAVSVACRDSQSTATSAIPPSPSQLSDSTKRLRLDAALEAVKTSCGPDQYESYMISITPKIRT